MTDWFEFEPKGGWQRVENRLTGVTFSHDAIDDTLVVIRLRGPSGTPGEYTEEYVLRHIRGPRTSWRTLLVTTDKETLKTECREIMKQFPAQSAREEVVLGRGATK